MIRPPMCHSLMSTPPVVVEVDSQAMDGLQGSKPRRRRSLSSDSVPEMIMTASLTSYSESDSDSLASSVRSASHAQSPRSPRSIFQNYWSSPTRKEEGPPASEEDVLARLQTLRVPMPLVDAGEDGGSPREEAKVVHERRPRGESLDDASIDYQPPPTRSPTRTARRQILPTPPPQTAISSSLLMQPRRPLLSSYSGGRPWKSTTALLKQPQSCLRKARYSCSAIATAEAAVTGAARLHHGLRNEGHPDLCAHELPPREGGLKKSVSFYSHVSVFEFAVPPEQRRSQKGWSEYFA